MHEKYKEVRTVDNQYSNFQVLIPSSHGGISDGSRHSSYINVDLIYVALPKQAVRIELIGKEPIVVQIYVRTNYTNIYGGIIDQF